MKSSSTQNNRNANYKPRISIRPRQVMLQKLAFGTSMFLLLVMFFGSIYYVRFSKLENAYGENLITKNAALHSLASGDSDQPNQSEKNKTVRGIKR